MCSNSLHPAAAYFPQLTRVTNLGSTNKICARRRHQTAPGYINQRLPGSTRRNRQRPTTNPQHGNSIFPPINARRAPIGQTRAPPMQLRADWNTRDRPREVGNPDGSRKTSRDEAPSNSFPKLRGNHEREGGRWVNTGKERGRVPACRPPWPCPSGS